MKEQKNNKNVDYTISSSFYIFVMIGLSVFITAPISLLSLKTNIIIIIIITVVEILSVTASVLFTIHFIGTAKEKYGNDFIDGVKLTLIIGFVFVSLLIAALLTVFGNKEDDLSHLKEALNVSWTVYGISIGLYLAIIAMPNVIHKSDNQNGSNKVSTDIIHSLFPNIVSLTSLIISTILLYGFYKSSNTIPINSLVSTSLISSLLTAPYYLLMGIHLIKRNSIN